MPRKSSTTQGNGSFAGFETGAVGTGAESLKSGGDPVSPVETKVGRKKRKRTHYTGRAAGTDEMRRLEEARSKLVQVLGRIRQFAQEAVQEIYGEHGPEWGIKFRDIEILGDVIGMEVASRFTESSVSGQAEAVPEEAGACPCCKYRGERDEQDEPRSLQTLTGIVNWEEAKFICHKCRRSFFPSESRFGN